ncbi:hypothetical protein AB6A40_006021 [Gnathostoma spinigerum]|uniref:Uncharacterized protein n=1 Tax=Gnathostoma spinigerum TaxID=75299 RepID=A0ABD6ERY3_9BILA
MFIFTFVTLLVTLSNAQHDIPNPTCLNGWSSSYTDLSSTMMPNPFYSKIKFDPEPSRNLFIAGFAYYWSDILEITFREQKSDAENVALWMELDYGNDRISLSHKKDGTWAEKKVIEKRLVNYINFAMKIAMGKWDNVFESRNYQLFYDDQSVGEYTSNVLLKKGIIQS